MKKTPQPKPLDWPDLKIQCHHCGFVLKKPGALIFSPPNKDNLCEKFHFCAECYSSIADDYIIFNEKIKVDYERHPETKDVIFQDGQPVYKE